MSKSAFSLQATLAEQKNKEDPAICMKTKKRVVGTSLCWGGFLKIISVGIPTYAGMKTGF